MKKLSILLLVMLSLLFSCSTVEEVPQAVYEEPVVSEEVLEKAEVAAVVESVPEMPEVEEPSPAVEPIPAVVEAPLEEAPVPEEEPEAAVEAAPEVVPPQPEAEKPAEDKVLTGKALVEQIREEENEKKNRDIETIVEKIREELPPERIEEKKAEVPVPAIKAEVPDTPVVEKPEDVVTAETPKKEETVLDTTIDADILLVSGEIISIMIIYALSSVIRNKYSKALSVGLSFLLAILFTAIPMLIAFILFGWSNWHLLFLSLIFTVFIFSNRRGH